MSEAGLLTCLDAKTGAVQYEGGRPPIPATFKSSLVAFGDKLLQTNEEGDTFVIKAGPKHEVLRTNTDRRTGLGLARVCARHHLHPRRQAPVRD